MWNPEKRRCLHDLRCAEAERALTSTERAELDGLFAELDAEEARALEPALARVAREASELGAERARLGTWATELEHIVEEQEQLLAEARAYAGRLRVRRAALADEARKLKAS